MFLPETGTPIWKMERIRTVLAVWLPDPLTVAICMEKSLTTVWPGPPTRGSADLGNRHAHLENGTHQDGVGGLAAGPVDCGDLYGEIVDYGMAGAADARLRRRYF